MRPSKRLRPLIAILAALATTGRLGQGIVRGAAAVEALHLASLLHDDVVDETVLRSGLPTPNVTFGNWPAVLLGDFFFARALRGAAAVSRNCFRRLLGVAEALIAGEFGQATSAGRLPSRDRYLSWIEAKTARLFVLAASLCGAEEQVLVGYGHSFGVAYQLRDDLLDLTACETELGKPILSDYRRGLYTFPLIVACAREPAARSLLAEARLDEPGWRHELDTILYQSGAGGATLAACRSWALLAQESIGALAPNPARQVLSDLAAWVGYGGEERRLSDAMSSSDATSCH